MNKSTIDNNTIVGAIGGGIYTSGNGQSAYIYQSTISNNVSGFGAGDGLTSINSNSSFFVVHSTVSVNTPNQIYSDSNVFIVSSTIVGNDSFPVMYLFSMDGELFARNSVVSSANGTIATVCDFEFPTTNLGPIYNTETNWFQDTSCTGTASGDPQLGPLQNNGGSTLSHKPMKDSELIDAGEDNIQFPVFTSLTTGFDDQVLIDQRG